jgi:hypothetical protein
MFASNGARKMRPSGAPIQRQDGDAARPQRRLAVMQNRNEEQYQPESLLAACSRFCRDEIFSGRYRLCSGPASAYVPYTDPGLKLAQVNPKEDDALSGGDGFRAARNSQNHGIIALGRWPDAVKAAMFMAESGEDLRGSGGSWRSALPLARKH